MSKKLTLKSKGVTVELIREDEDHGYIDDFDDEQSREWIRDQVSRGNEWAWCMAHVRVTYTVERKGSVPATLHGDAYLGACSYESEKDFREGGYYDDMVSEALDDLNQAREDLRVLVK